MWWVFLFIWRLCRMYIARPQIPTAWITDTLKTMPTSNHNLSLFILYHVFRPCYPTFLWIFCVFCVFRILYHVFRPCYPTFLCIFCVFRHPSIMYLTLLITTKTYPQSKHYTVLILHRCRPCHTKCSILHLPQNTILLQWHSIMNKFWDIGGVK